MALEDNESLSKLITGSPKTNKVICNTALYANMVILIATLLTTITTIDHDTFET